MYCPAKIKVDQNWLSINGKYLSVRALNIYIYFFLRDTILDLTKNALPLLDPKFLEMWEKIGTELQIECAAHHGMALEFSSNSLVPIKKRIGMGLLWFA
jgi:hypothetical protein